METLRFRWYGPYTIEEANEFCEFEDYGLYQITRLWGNSETLLYIGMTYSQDFRKRLIQHDWWLSSIKGARVRLGYLELEKGQRTSYERIKDAENLLIWCLEPPENTQNIQTYSGRDLIIRNLGKKGPLPRTIDSNYWDE